MTYSEPQLIQMARTVAHAVKGGDPRAVEYLGRVAERTGLHPVEVLRRLHAQAAPAHPLDGEQSLAAWWAAASTSWGAMPERAGA
jgi:hypothetical protein